MNRPPSRILLVEGDDVVFASILSAFTHHGRGMAITRTRNLSEARCKLEKMEPDLVIAEADLDDGRGLDLIPSPDGEFFFPVLIISGRDEPGEARTKTNAGAVDLVKITESSVSELPEISLRAMHKWQLLHEKRLAEKALGESEKKYRTLFESANNSIFLLSDGIALDCNKIASHIFHRPKTDLIGADPFSFSPVRQPDGELSSQKSRAMLNAALAGRSQRFEWVYSRPDGSVFESEVVLNQIEIMTESFVMAVINDITEQKAAGEALRRRDAFLEAMVVVPVFVGNEWWGFIRLDEMRRPRIWTQGEVDALILGSRIFSSTVRGVRSRTALEASERKYRSLPYETSILEKEVMVHGYSRVYEKEFIRKDGGVAPAEMRAYLLRDEAGEPEGFWAVIRDISNRKKSEKELNKARLVAERSAQELKKNLYESEAMRLAMEEAKVEAETANRAKSVFLANMSHEIRTPLNGVISMTSLLAETPLSGRQKDYLETLRQSAEALLDSINDILDYSKIEAGRLEVEFIPFDLEKIVVGTMDMMAVKAAEKGIDLFLRLPTDPVPKLLGDPGRIRQILINLTGNAVKFTEKGHVLVDVRLSPGISGLADLKITVEDTGVGIPPEKHEMVFELFSQADESTTRKYGGTGLGLAICRQLAELMGGGISLDSKPSEGSRFSFYATLKKVGSEYYDLVLMDVQMPEMDGLEATAKIRAEGGEAGDIPIIALTAGASIEDRARCLAAGMNGYLTKPLRRKELEAALKSVWLPGESVFISSETCETQTLIDRDAEVWDRKGALDRLDGDKYIFKEIVEAFFEAAPERLDRIRDGMEKGNLTVVQDTSHTLKSGASYIGAERLRAAAQAAEFSSGKGNRTDALEAVQAVEEEYNRLLEEMDSYIWDVDG